MIKHFSSRPSYVGLVFSEYLLSGQVPSVKEVNDEEPLFFNLSLGASCQVSQGYFYSCTDHISLLSNCLCCSILAFRGPCSNTHVVQLMSLVMSKL